MEKLTYELEPNFHIYNYDVEEFKQNISRVIDSDTFVGIINCNKCNNVKAFHKEVKEQMHFPDYYGNNFAAFDECMTDLIDILNKNKFIIFFQDFDNVFSDYANEEVILNQHSKKISLVHDILYKIAMEWKTGFEYGALKAPPTPFHIILNNIYDKSILNGIEFDFLNREVHSKLKNIAR